MIKYWLEVSNDEPARRFQARIEEPLRANGSSAQWTCRREAGGTSIPARAMMLDATDASAAESGAIDGVPI